MLFFAAIIVLAGFAPDISIRLFLVLMGVVGIFLVWLHIPGFSEKGPIALMAIFAAVFVLRKAWADRSET